MKRICCTLAVALTLVACGKQESKEENKPGPNFLSSQQKYLQKARQVEADVQKSADTQRAEVDKQTGASNAAE